MPSNTSSAEGDPFAETHVHVGLQRATAARVTDITAITVSDRWWPETSDDLDAALTLVADRFAPDAAPDTLVVDVLSQFLRLAPAFQLINTTHEPATAEFHWSWVRCLLSGAGYAAFKPLAVIACTMYPLCPLGPDETQDEWSRLLRDAHLQCGWPVTLAFIPWTRAYYGMDPVDSDTDIPLWCRVTALMHVLKHIRIDGAKIVGMFNGKAKYWTMPPGTNVLSTSKPLIDGLSQTLGHTPGKKSDGARPLGWAIYRTLKAMTTANLLARRPLLDLPGQVFYGAWSGLSPSPSDATGFTSTGLRLDGVWLAANGHITPFEGSDSDALVWGWALDNTAHMCDERMRWESVLPATYQADLWPSQTFTRIFPNTNTVWAGLDEAAYFAVFDAILCAGLLRRQVPALMHEFPVVLIQPQTPSPGLDTNQGKTLAAFTLARVVAPTIQVIVANDTGSAPDTRAMASAIAQHGTICLDEWSMPASQSAFLCHRNIQSLLTGGTVSVGRVLENTGSVMLRQSMFASCKFADFPADMLTRTFPVYLDPLSRDARSDGVTEWAIKSGACSVDMRLAAIGLCERHDLAAVARNARQGSNAWRFPAHVALAAKILSIRTGLAPDAANNAIEEVIGKIKCRLLVHARDAETSGLALRVREGVTVNLGPDAVFNDITDQTMTQIVQHAEVHGRTTDDVRYVTAGVMLRARLNAMGGRDDTPLHKLLPPLTGQDAKVSDRTLSMAFGESLTVACGADGFVPPGTSWRIHSLILEERRFFTFQRTV